MIPLGIESTVKIFYLLGKEGLVREYLFYRVIIFYLNVVLNAVPESVTGK